MTTSSKLAATVLTLALIVPSCGGGEQDEAEYVPWEGPTGGKADDPEPAEDPPEEPPPDVSGIYAVLVETDISARNIETGEIAVNSISMHGLVTVTQEGADVSLSTLPCRATLPEMADRQPTIDDDVVQGLEPIGSNGTVSVQPGEEGEAPVVHLDTDPAALLLGVRLDDPFADPLPTNGRDPAVFDEDGDRRPGISIKVSGFKVYGGIRVIFGLAGTLGETGEIAGDATMAPEYQIYGDSIPFFDAKAAIEEANANNEIIGEENRFRLVPVTSEEPSCTDVLEGDLF